MPVGRALETEIILSVRSYSLAAGFRASAVLGRWSEALRIGMLEKLLHGKLRENALL
jgi:hypothetical protein